MPKTEVKLPLVIMGVAGCGKSSIGALCAAALRLPLLEGDHFHSPASLAKMRSGAALTDGAVGPNPGRTNAEIETYLADLLAQGKLDADGDGQSLAMTDGLLILRAMLGLYNVQGLNQMEDGRVNERQIEDRKSVV